MSTYAKLRFNYRQMEQIRLGLEHRVDVSCYVKPKVSWEQMAETRLRLENGMEDVGRCAE